MANRKVMIVIEETGTNNGKGFNIYLAGDIERFKSPISEKDMTPAEFYGMKLFKICIGALVQIGVIKNVVPPGAH